MFQVFKQYKKKINLTLFKNNIKTLVKMHMMGNQLMKKTLSNSILKNIIIKLSKPFKKMKMHLKIMSK